MKRARLAVLAALLSLCIAACYSDPAAVLDEHGWTQHEQISQQRVLIGVFEARAWNRYLAASRQIGLDFESWWGREAHVISYDLGAATGHVLVDTEQPIGAWLTTADERVVPLNSDEVPRP